MNQTLLTTTLPRKSWARRASITVAALVILFVAAWRFAGLSEGRLFSALSDQIQRYIDDTGHAPASLQQLADHGYLDSRLQSFILSADLHYLPVPETDGFSLHYERWCFYYATEQPPWHFASSRR